MYFYERRGETITSKSKSSGTEINPKKRKMELEVVKPEKIIKTMDKNIEESLISKTYYLNKKGKLKLFKHRKF